MQVKIKKLTDNAVTPQYSKQGDAGLDLVAVSKETVTIMEETYYNSEHKLEQLCFIEYGTGLSLEIPEGYVGLVFPRSSVSNVGLSLSNSVGIIDSGYRGEIKLRFYSTSFSKDYREYEIGDKIGQIIILPYPQIQFEEVKGLAASERDTAGFGSSGR